jgi:hypothetical protein
MRYGIPKNTTQIVASMGGQRKAAAYPMGVPLSNPVWFFTAPSSIIGVWQRQRSWASRSMIALGG